MRYLGSDIPAPAGGWVFKRVADRFVVGGGEGEMWSGLSLSRDADLVFGPATVQLSEDEMRVAAASAARWRNSPAAEREQCGRFWDEWLLLGDGRFSRRDDGRKARQG